MAESLSHLSGGRGLRAGGPSLPHGTLDLRTRELRTHDRADHITKLAPVEYRPDATAPTFEKFLAQILPSEELRAFALVASSAAVPIVAPGAQNTRASDAGPRRRRVASVRPRAGRT